MNLLFLLLISALLLTSNAKVSLNSSALRVCPGSTLVFTCTTDTGKLVWKSGGDNHLYVSGQYSNGLLDNIFTLNLTIVTGMVLVSTATLQNVLIGYNGRTILCYDSINMGASMNRTIQISGQPSSPLNLTFTSSTPYLVTISWVAPLDTPFCVHSYIVTVTNSSQVMVYNTTDNRSSLSITDLTSDGEYSVTVAGRDGAGRLGQKSDKLKIGLKGSNFFPVNVVPSLACNLSNISHTEFILRSNILGLLMQWKHEGNCTQLQANQMYLIAHNVSSDQSLITVNRTNVTLYGVQPGETYAVEITPLSTHTTVSSSLLIQVSDVVSTNCEHVTTEWTPEWTFHNNSVWVISNSLSWVLPLIAIPWMLLIMLILFLLVCILSKKVNFKWPRRDTTVNRHSIILSKRREEGERRTTTYEEVEKLDKDAFAVKKNPSYSVPACLELNKSAC